jgi:hypothetical protein
MCWYQKYFFKKNIILMYFWAKSTLNHNRYYIFKHTLKNNGFYITLSSKLCANQFLNGEKIKQRKNLNQNSIYLSIKFKLNTIIEFNYSIESVPNSLKVKQSQPINCHEICLKDGNGISMDRLWPTLCLKQNKKNNIKKCLNIVSVFFLKKKYIW